ncbi:hypothetical protein CRUP_025882 [Coryphaenoides rupestris]|nr:hypothetical protein CRUP_025882 [Coryphaenoides rupestris]
MTLTRLVWSGLQDGDSSTRSFKHELFSFQAPPEEKLAAVPRGSARPPRPAASSPREQRYASAETHSGHRSGEQGDGGAPLRTGMSQPCEEPRFTIEQIDLLQRLWRSGMTQAEIVHALDTLDRLERQHSRLPSPRTRPPGPRSRSSSSTASTATQTCFPGNGASPGNLYRTSPPLLASAPTPAAMAAAVAAAENGLAAMANGKLSPPRFPVAMIGSSGGVVAQSYGFETTEEDLEMDSAVIKEEIKNFLGNRRISQAVVAQGLARAGSPHWLVQQGSDLSDQKKRAFYRWYLLEKTNPGASRFTWRKECLSVMESYFGDNQYPDEAKREEIASACNAVIQKPEAAILESHGMDVVSPGGHSNSDEVDGNEFPEQGSEGSVFDKRVANRAFGLGRIDLSSPTQVPSLLPSWLAAWPGLGRGGDEPTNHSSPTEVQDPISLAVEMAAVNHTILALANQGTEGGVGGSTGNDIKMDSAVIKEEIKNFLGNRRISQAVVAQVTGISQSRISHWLVQQGSDLSDQKKRAFYRWYLLEKTNPDVFLVEWHQTPPSFGLVPGGSRLRRGSRFTWRKECLSVMESYFGDNQYPDEAKREEIASACNAVIQKPGKKLSDLERVTSLKVYNWFANRRKEMKRRANIEAAILESHGMDVVSPGGHSNSDEVDGNEFPEQGSEGSVFDKRTDGVSWSPPSPSLQDEPTNHSSPTEVQDPISLAVEMAAVNHTILALANQGTEGGVGGSTGNDIKSETMEDD